MSSSAPRPQPAAGIPGRVPSRRSVLVGGAAAVASAALAGCGVRLERDSPSLPLLAPRQVDPRAVALYQEVRRVRDALAAATAVSTAQPAAASEAGAITLAGRLATIHGEQLEVLRDRIRELGEDPDDPARLDAAVRAASREPAGPLLPTLPAQRLAAAQAQGLTPADLGALDQLPRDEAPLLFALRVQRAVALPLVGGTAPGWTTPVIPIEAQAARLVSVFRAAQYGLEVAAARTLGPVRDRLLGPLTWAGAVRNVLEPQAGTRPQEAPAGFTLPFPVADDASAVRLGQVVLTQLTDTVLAGVGPLAGHADGLVAVLALAAVAEGQAHALGAGLRAFPGLRRR